MYVVNISKCQCRSFKILMMQLSTADKLWNSTVASFLHKKNVSLIGHVLDLSVVLISLFYLSLQVCISVLLVIFGYFHKNIEPGKWQSFFLIVNNERENVGWCLSLLNWIPSKYGCKYGWFLPVLVFEPVTVCIIQVKCATNFNGIFKLLIGSNIEFK